MVIKVRKAAAFLLGILSAYSFIGGMFLKISNIQGQRMPDGNPLDPEWLVWVLALAVPALAGILAAIIWPPKNPVEKTREILKNNFYCIL